VFDNISVLLFMGSCFFVIYVYLGYPGLLWLLSSIRKGQKVEKSTIEPHVTILISAYNEEDVIADKILNSLQLEYPAGKLEIVVVSDCSSDKTDEIVRQFSDQGVVLVAMSERGGKTVGLNKVVPVVKGEIVVFSDANAIYDRDVLIKIVRNFADQQVGAVTCSSQYVIDENDNSTENEDLYWKYELAIKQMESKIGSLVGGDGAIYAIRKRLYQKLRASDLSDFVNPLQIVAQGYRNVFEAEAISHEKGGKSFENEFKRKVRIVNRGFRGLMRVKKVMNPFRYGFFSLQVISHKLLRWLIPVFLVCIFVSNFFIAATSMLLAFTFSFQSIFYALALIGYILRKREKTGFVFYIPYYFCLVNWASLLGIIDNLRGKTYTHWNTVRDKESLEVT